MNSRPKRKRASHDPQPLVLVVVLGILVAIADYFIGIKEPWRKVIYIALVIFLVIAIVMILMPGLFPLI